MPKQKRLHSGEKKIIASVMEKCLDEKETNEIRLSLDKCVDRAADYCGVSSSSVNRVQSEKKKLGVNGTFSTPKKSNSKPAKYALDSFDQVAVKNIVREFYVMQKTVPTLANLVILINSRLELNLTRTTLWRILKVLGFQWKSTQSLRKVLMERPDIVAWRGNYLEKIKKFREEGRRIFYTDETWIDTNMTVGKCWQLKNDVEGVHQHISSSARLIIVHIGSTDGFLKEGELIFKSGSATGDYHGQMNAENFERWITTQVLPFLPPNSVVVMDNAPYHTVMKDRVPTKSATKAKMMAWLDDHNVKYDSMLRKSKIFELIMQHKPAEKKFRVDELLKEHGHEALRLPPYGCDLNPIEMIWANVKGYVKAHNTAGNMSFTKLKELTAAAFQKITPEVWEKTVKHSMAKEEEYWKTDVIIDHIVDQMIINLGEVSDSDSDSDSPEATELSSDDE